MPVGSRPGYWPYWPLRHSLRVLYWDTIVVLLLGLAAGLAIGIVESFLARSRMARNSTYIVTILAVALVAFVIAFLLLNQIRIG